MHPSPPEDLGGLVDALAHTTQAVVDLTFNLSEDEFAKPTECPGWTVKDVVSHVVSLDLLMLGRPDKQIEVPDYPYIRNKIGRRAENGVELRRSRPGKDIVDELQRAMTENIGRLRSANVTEDTLVPTVFGELPLKTALPRKIIDTYCHEQDIRSALDRIGNLDSPAATVWVDAILQSLPDVVAVKAGIEPGKVVMIELTGPVTARAGVRVDTADGKPVGHPMFSRGTDETGPIPVIGRTTSIQMATEPFQRRAAGRRAVADLHYSVHGDEDVARRVLEALSLTP